MLRMVQKTLELDPDHLWLPYLVQDKLWLTLDIGLCGLHYYTWPEAISVYFTRSTLILTWRCTIPTVELYHCTKCHV